MKLKPANVLRPELIRRPLEVSCELSQCADVGFYGTLSAVATLELLQYHFSKMAEFDPVKTRMVELHYFFGCTIDETAEILELSSRTVQRGLHFSLAWLRRALA
jgi:DNA-directed RNA polymerase specialized sigma24 family protein